MLCGRHSSSMADGQWCARSSQLALPVSALVCGGARGQPSSTQTHGPPSRHSATAGSAADLIVVPPGPHALPVSRTASMCSHDVGELRGEPPGEREPGRRSEAG